MKITKSGFYNISNISEDIEIGAYIGVALYDERIGKRNIYVSSGSTLNLFSFYEGGNEYEKYVFLQEMNAKAYVKILSFSRNTRLGVKVKGEVFASSTFLDIDMVSLVYEAGNINIDGTVSIGENLEKVEGYLHEKNIFLGDTGTIRGVPALFVHSNDVKAGHSCNIERLSEDKLFYMKSRGISEEETLRFFILGYIDQIFICMKNIDDVFYKNMLDTISKKFI